MMVISPPDGEARAELQFRTSAAVLRMNGAPESARRVEQLAEWANTQLTSMEGRRVGVLSTHYPQPAQLPERDLLILRRFRRLIGERLGATRAAPFQQAPASALRIAE
jgi:hypothetical protein